MLIFSSSPFPIMRLPARKGIQKNNFWLDHCYLLLEKNKDSKRAEISLDIQLDTSGLDFKYNKERIPF